MNNNNFKFISVDVIANRVKKHPLLKTLNYEDIISHTYDVLRLVRVPHTYVEDSVYKDIVDFKVKIPNLINIKAIDYLKECGSTCPMVVSTDTHINQIHNLTYQDRNNCEYTYSLNNGMIHTNQKEGQLFIVFTTLKCDDNGFPMIPDNISLIKAIENYIKAELFSMYVDMGKIGPASLDRAEQQYAWYLGQAQTSFQGLHNEDDMEKFLADFKKLFIVNNTHKNRHMYNSNRELRLR